MIDVHFNTCFYNSAGFVCIKRKSTEWDTTASVGRSGGCSASLRSPLICHVLTLPLRVSANGISRHFYMHCIKALLWCSNVNVTCQPGGVLIQYNMWQWYRISAAFYCFTSWGKLQYLLNPIWIVSSLQHTLCSDSLQWTNGTLCLILRYPDTIRPFRNPKKPTETRGAVRVVVLSDSPAEAAHVRGGLWSISHRGKVLCQWSH